MSDYEARWMDIEEIWEFDGISTELMDCELIDKIYRGRTDPKDEDDEGQEK